MITTAILAIVVFFSNGITCGNPPVSNSSATTPRFNASLCVKSDVGLCGITYRLAPVTEAGLMRVNSRKIGPAFGDTTQEIAFPRPIARETSGDWGGTYLTGPTPPGTHLIATYNVTVLNSKPATNYAFKLDPISIIIPDPGKACGINAIDRSVPNWQTLPVEFPEFVELPIAAEFTLKKK